MTDTRRGTGRGRRTAGDSKAAVPRAQGLLGCRIDSGHWLHAVEPNRYACGGVLDKTRRRFRTDRGRDECSRGCRQNQVEPAPAIQRFDACCGCARQPTGGCGLVTPVILRGLSRMDAERLDGVDRLEHLLDLPPAGCNSLSPPRGTCGTVEKASPGPTARMMSMRERMVP
jgi:hypothetical protein